VFERNAMGEAGLISRGADEDGMALHELSDPSCAARLILHPEKLDAYVTGTIPFRRVGPGNGIWKLPGGHQFHPQHPDDKLGQITYTVELGLPEWPVSFDAATVKAIKEKWWPNGAPKAEPRGSSGTDKDRRPLSGVLAWSDEAERSEVFAHSGRYEWRCQELATARRRRDGELADMRHEDSTLVASWREEELARHIAAFIDQAVEKFLGEHPEAQVLRFVPRAEPRSTPQADAMVEHERQIRALEESANQAATQRAGARANANELRAKGDSDGAAEFFADVTTLREREKSLRAEIETLRAHPPTPLPTPASEDHIDLEIGTPAAVVVALSGPHAAGAQPAVLHEALVQLLGEGGNLRLDLIPESKSMVRVSGAVRLRCADDSAHEIHHQLDIPAKVATTGAQERLHELAHHHMWLGTDLAAMSAIGRSRDAATMLRQIREYVGAGVRRPDPDPRTRTAQVFTAQGARIADAGLRGAAVTAPLELRQVLWADQCGLQPPAGLPRGYALHVLNHYLSRPGTESNTWQGPWARPKKTRNQALVVLASRESTRQLGMRADHLAACLGVPVRTINDVSRALPAQGRTDPATLERLDPWRCTDGEQLDPEEKRVRPIHCEHKTDGRPCRGQIEAALYVPEIFAQGAGGVCSTCHRAPGHTQRYPDSYAANALADRDQHSGEWVPCGYAACEVDFGAGPGLMWRWHDGPATVWHDNACRAGRAPAPPSPRLTPCANDQCTINEGHGIGIIANTGRAARRWHTHECQTADRLARRQRAAAARPSRACALPGCTLDEGAGPGMLAPKSRPTRKWHSFTCRNEALRLKAGADPHGTISWSTCAHTDCTVDEGGGPGQIRIVAGAPGRPRRYHDDRCSKRGSASGR
jgi:hypothetical protein